MGANAWSKSGQKVGYKNRLGRKKAATLDRPPPILYNGIATERLPQGVNLHETPPSSGNYPRAFLIYVNRNISYTRDLQQQLKARITPRSSCYHLPLQNE